GSLTPCPIAYLRVRPPSRVSCIAPSRSGPYSLNLVLPNNTRPWSCTRGALLHQMVHQWLVQTDRDPAHTRQNWCNAIMQLSRVFFGKSFWAGYRSLGNKRDDNGVWRSVAINMKGPTGEESIPQQMIAEWPLSVGIVPPDLEECV